MDDAVSKISDTTVMIETTQVTRQVASVDDLVMQRIQCVAQQTNLDSTYAKQSKILADSIARIDNILQNAKNIGVLIPADAIPVETKDAGSSEVVK